MFYENISHTQYSLSSPTGLVIELLSDRPLLFHPDMISHKDFQLTNGSPSILDDKLISNNEYQLLALISGKHRKKGSSECTFFVLFEFAYSVNDID